MSEYFNCGFARVAVRESIFKGDGTVEKDNKKRIASFLAKFQGSVQDKFHVIPKQYNKASKKLLTTFNSWSTYGGSKEQYISHFSSSNWSTLPEAQKRQHSRVNCQGCLVQHHIIQATFPIKPARLNPLMKANLMDTSKDIAKNVENNKPTVQPTKQAIKSTLQDVYTTINSPFLFVFSRI